MSGCFERLPVPWQKPRDLMGDAAGDHLSENFRELDRWANMLEDTCNGGGGVLDAVMYQDTNGFDLDPAGGAVENIQFPSSSMDAGGTPAEATDAYATSGVTAVANSAPVFSGTNDGLFLCSVSGHFTYQDHVSRTETVLQTQFQGDSLLPPGPLQDHVVIGSDAMFFDHTALLYGGPGAVAIHNLSAHACFVTQFQYSVTRLVTDLTSFTKVV